MVREGGLEVHVFHFMYSNPSNLAKYKQKTENQVSIRPFNYHFSNLAWVIFVVKPKGVFYEIYL